MSGPFGSTTWMSNPSTEFFGHEITNSCRFNDNDSAYLNITPSSAGNVDTWTFSAWVKVGNTVNGPQGIFYASTGIETNSNSTVIYFNDGGILKIRQVNSDSQTVSVASNAVFRDPSAWYHIVVACDTTQGTDTNRIKLYVNGVQITSLSSTTYPSQNADTFINSANIHVIGKYPASGAYYWDGYMAEVNLIDGLQLTPSSFGEFKNDIWIPKDTAGLTFGDQGWRLQFKQVGTGTASTSTIGADTSGETNHWTSNNLVASDVMPDSPTLNFGTFNSIHDDTTGASTEVFSQGNLRVGESGNGWSNIFGSQGMPSGKWYWESYMAGSGTVDCLFGIAKSNWYIGSDGGLETAGAYTIYQHSNGNLYSWNNASQTNEGTTVTFTWDDILQVAYDADTGKLWFGKSNTWLFSGDPAAGSTPKMTIGASDIGDMLPAWSQYHPDNAWGVNFGQDSSFAGNETAQGNADANGIGDFYYAPPSGFLALCTANLPDPVETIDPAQGGSPQDYFNTVLYTGNGADNHAISGVGFQPDWVWMKSRNNARSNAFVDSVRGRGSILYSDLTNAQEAPAASNNDLVSFDTDGFTVGTPERAGSTNTNNDTIVAWNWKAGTAFSNDASSTSVGTIDSAGSVSADTGFSIISYTGTGSNGTVAHGLGKSLDMFIVKNRDRVENWPVYVRAAGDGGLFLDVTNAYSSSSSFTNNTDPTSSVFSIGTNAAINVSGEDCIAYCFASVQGYSKFGSYTGNSNANGPFIYTGFRPAFLLIRKTNAVENWAIHDSKRVDYGVNSNPINNYLKPDQSDAEGDDGASVDFLSNGFKWRLSSGMRNNSGDTYVYMAFAEQPFKYANAR